MPQLSGPARRSATPGVVRLLPARGRWRCLLCEADGGNGQPEWATSADPYSALTAHLATHHPQEHR